MNHWTDSAKAKLEEYFVRIRQTLAASGADVNEVTDDLRRHVEEEVAARQLAVVTEQDVGSILARIGAPEIASTLADRKPAPPPGAPPPAPTARKSPGLASIVLRILVLLFGVVLPFATIGYEYFNGICAAVLFDPFPTVAHIVLAALVPGVNLLVWLAWLQDRGRWRAWLGWANGFAIAVAAVYVTLLLPFTPIAFIGILAYGLGLLPLGPLSALICAIVLRWRLRHSGGETSPLPGLWRGVALGVGCLIAFTLPMILTNIGLRMATSDSGTEQTRGIRLLRAWGQEEELLRACYGGRARGGRRDFDWEFYSHGPTISAEDARTIYYRVKGQPFNSVPPPKLYANRARWDTMEESYTWDNDQAGDAVAGRVRGLSLLSSRQDGVIEPDAALAYLEWTLEFKNVSHLQREARAQLSLPPGAVVSRLTLWIDGEEREAAFGGRSQVKTAYKDVVSRRRDPVMVTTCGPDLVLVQCFPIQPDGGTMKVRLGITAPLAITNTASGFLHWPCFTERNFTIAEQFHHSLWVESSQPVEVVGGRLKTEQGKPGIYVVRGSVSDTELSAPTNTIQASRAAGIRQVWTKDTRESDGYIIRQQMVEKPAFQPDRVVLVIDGSAGMGNAYRGISDALMQLPSGIDFAVLLADDGLKEWVPLQKGSPAIYQKTALWKAESAGGQDNLPALVRAWDLAAEAKSGVIVWVHGPQPVLLQPAWSVDPADGSIIPGVAGDLQQRFERSSNPPLLYHLQTRTGPNRILEQLDGVKSVHSVLRMGDVGEDIGRLFAGWKNGSGVLELKRERVPSSSLAGPPDGKEASMHLSRLWAFEEVSRLRRARQSGEAEQLAARYQLVTPASGAVVLETAAQYSQAGLEPVPAESAPLVPEPSIGLFGLLGLVLLAWSRRRRSV